MDARTNPYAPDAGTPPPVLAGRDALLDGARLAIDRVSDGKSAKTFIAVGLRGVGKTVILNQVQQIASERDRVFPVYIEAFDDIKLADALAKALRPILTRLSRSEAVTHVAKRALSGLRDFAAAFKISIQGIDV